MKKGLEHTLYISEQSESGQMNKFSIGTPFNVDPKENLL